MPKQEPGRLAQIHEAALNRSIPVSQVLQMCVLHGRDVAGSEELRTWATKELDGYQTTETLPDYRVMTVVLTTDRTTVGNRITGKVTSRLELPDFAGDLITGNTYSLYGGVAEIEELAARAEKSDGRVHLDVGEGAELARLWTIDMRRKGNQYDSIDTVYWTASEATVRAVLGQIRTRLVALLGEIEDTTPQPKPVPNAAVSQGINLTQGRRSRAYVTVAQAANDSTATVETKDDDTDNKSLVLKVMGWLWEHIVEVSIIAGAVIAYITYLAMK